MGRRERGSFQLRALSQPRRTVSKSTNRRSSSALTANRRSCSNVREANRCSEPGETPMSVALGLEFEAYRPRLYALPDQPARLAPSPRVRRRRVVLAATVVALLVLLALPIRALGGSTLTQAAPVQGQEYIVKTGDTLASIAAQADPC